MAKTSGFQLSGSGPELYEACWVPAQMGRCAEDLVITAEIHSGDRVLDVGCGTGVAAREAARRTTKPGDVTGTDINEGMIKIAKDVARKHGLPSIVWQQCDTACMPFDNEAFNVVLCQQGLQFMPDRSAAMTEMVRVLAPGGRLAVSVWRSQSPFGRAVGKVLDQRFGEGTTAPWQVVYSFGDRNELRSLAENAGLENARVFYDIKMLRHPVPEEFVLGALVGSPLADVFDALAYEERASIVKEIVASLKPYHDDYGLAVPAECHTLTAQKAVPV